MMGFLAKLKRSHGLAKLMIYKTSKMWYARKRLTKNDKVEWSVKFWAF